MSSNISEVTGTVLIQGSDYIPNKRSSHIVIGFNTDVFNNFLENIVFHERFFEMWFLKEDIFWLSCKNLELMNWCKFFVNLFFTCVVCVRGDG